MCGAARNWSAVRAAPRRNSLSRRCIGCADGTTDGSRTFTRADGIWVARTSRKICLFEECCFRRLFGLEEFDQIPGRINHPNLRTARPADYVVTVIGDAHWKFDYLANDRHAPRCRW